MKQVFPLRPALVAASRRLTSAVLMAGVAAFAVPALAQEDRIDVMVAVDPSDASVAVPTAEVSRRLSAAVGKPVRVVMASGLKDAKRASRTSENQC